MRHEGARLLSPPVGASIGAAPYAEAPVQAGALFGRIRPCHHEGWRRPSMPARQFVLSERLPAERTPFGPASHMSLVAVRKEGSARVFGTAALLRGDGVHPERRHSYWHYPEIGGGVRPRRGGRRKHSTFMLPSPRACADATYAFSCSRRRRVRAAGEVDEATVAPAG